MKVEITKNGNIVPAFDIGDVVKLRSGGPTMSIYDVIGDDTVICQWFDSGDREQRTDFNVACLVYGVRRDKSKA